jgi:hypothetical protein
MLSESDAVKYDIVFYFGSGLELTFWSVPVPESLPGEVAMTPGVVLQLLWDDVQQGWFFDSTFVPSAQVEFIKINEVYSSDDLLTAD